MDQARVTDVQAVIRSREEQGEEHEGKVQSARENVHYQHVDKESGKMMDSLKISRYSNAIFRSVYTKRA